MLSGVEQLTSDIYTSLNSNWTSRLLFYINETQPVNLNVYVLYNVQPDNKMLSPGTTIQKAPKQSWGEDGRFPTWVANWALMWHFSCRGLLSMFDAGVNSDQQPYHGVLIVFWRNSDPFVSGIRYFILRFQYVQTSVVNMNVELVFG